MVPVGDIIDALWGTEPPPSAVKSVQVYVVRVRNALEPQHRAAEGSRLERRGSGYSLTVGRDEVDVLRFADLLAEGRDAAAAGSPDAAARMFREALGLWRGAPYADFQDTLFGSAEAARLDEMRLTVLEERIDADLALGKHGDVIGELEALVHQHPLHEPFWAQLMLALYRGGRQSDALLAFRRARSHLVEEMGIEPGPELRRLEAAVLAQDAALALPGPPGGSGPELPPGLARVGPAFVGRDDVLARLMEYWTDALDERGGVVLITGSAGSGRTRLAAELAHRVHAAGAVVHAVGEYSRTMDPSAGPATLVASAGGGPVLAVLDDVDRADQDVVRFLKASLTAAESLRLLIIAGYDPESAGAELRAIELRVAHGRRVQLRPLGQRDAALIVRRYLGASAEAGAVERIVGQAGGLPGALHARAAAWAQEDAARRVSGAARQAPLAWHALSVVRAEVRDGVLDLQRARDERVGQLGPEAGAKGAVVCPYKGLARFEKEDAAIFHGREALVAALIARLVDTLLVAVTGPSGAGKSSLVRAGLLPALAAGVLPGSEQWWQYVLSPGRSPRRELARVAGCPVVPGAVVVVDQFEELFTACDDEGERAGFIGDLTGLCDRGSATCRVVLTVRADFLGRCAAYQELAERLGEGTVLVGPMTDAEAQRAVETPARYAGLSVEPDLLDAVVTDVHGRPGALPLLSTALLDTWERRRGRTLTHAGYLAAGGVSGALARLAESAYARLTPAGQEAARRILVRLAEPGEAGVAVRRRVPLEEMAAPGDTAARGALDLLAARRLLTVERDSVEVAHEALLSHWPRLARWLEEDEQGRALRRHLAPTAREWARTGHPDAELYRGARLASALDWAAGHGHDLNPVETEFLEASRAAADRELREERDRANREARSRRRLRVVLAGVLVLLLFSAAAAVVAVQQRSAARAAQRTAEAGRLGARALTEPDLDRSLLLAAAAVRTSPSLETDGDLLAALTRGPYALAQVRGDGDRILGLALSPGGRVLVASDVDGTLAFWDTRTMRRLGRPVQIGAFSDGIAFSPDGGRLAVIAASPAEGVYVAVWDIVARRMVYRLRLPVDIGITHPAQAVAWTRDGREIAVESGTGSLRLYDAATGHQTGSVTVPGAGATHPVDAYPAGNAVVAIAEGTRTAVLADPATARIVRKIVLPVREFGAGVSRGGRTLAVGSAKGAVFFENLRTGQVRKGKGHHAGGVTDVVFSPDGRRAASLSNDRTVTVWDARTGQPRLTLTGHSGSPISGVFAPGGRTLYTAGQDATAIAWDVTGNRSFGVTRPDVPRGPFGVNASGGLPYVGWSADRRRVVIGYTSGLVTGIDAATGRVTAQSKPANELEDLAVSPDGRYVYLTSAEAPVQRWDTVTHRLDKVSTPLKAEGAMAISPDGRLLVVCGLVSNRPAPCYFADTTTLGRVGPRVVAGFTPGTPAFSPNGRLLALGAVSGRGLSILAIPSGKVRWANRSLGEVLPLGFSPDGRRLVVAFQNGSIAIFDAATGRRLTGPTVAQAGLVLSASFAPDGGTLLTSGTDGTVRLWEAAHLRPVGEPLPLLAGEGAFGAFSPDGTRILALDTTGRVTTWPATVQAWLRRACLIVRRGFTPYERTLYSIPPQSPRPCR